MEYALHIGQRAEKEVARLPPYLRRQVTEKILSLQVNPLPPDVKPLVGEEDAYRVDSGAYRILYHLDHSTRTIAVFRVRHRKDVYRTL